MNFSLFIQFIVNIYNNYNKLEVHIDHIKKINDMIEHYYGNKITYDSYVLGKDQVTNDIKYLLTDDILLELINVKKDNKFNLKLMESIINTLDTNLWHRYASLLSGTNNIKFIKTIGIYLLKLNPCPTHYRDEKNNFKSLLELDDQTINAIKPEFMRIFSIQFKLILKNEIKNYCDMDKIKIIRDNIKKIFN
jgi:hypothetical protein